MKNSLLALSAMAMLLASCGNMDRSKDNSQTSSEEPKDRRTALANEGSSQNTATTEADRRLVQDVQRALSSQKNVPQEANRSIQINANNGVVQLKGTVASNEVRDNAASAARSVSGVRRVDNQLQVQAR